MQHLVIYVPYEQLKDDEVATKGTSIAQNAAQATENLLAQVLLLISAEYFILFQKVFTTLLKQLATKSRNLS